MATQKTVQANYSAELIALIVAEYNALIVEHKGDNKQVLALLSEKHGKTVPSIRAKLSYLKVYKTANSADNAPTVASGKATKKEDIAQTISAIVGHELVGLEAATKQALLDLLAFLLKANKLLAEKEAKIESLIAEMLENSDNA